LENFSESQYYSLIDYANALIRGRGPVLVTAFDLVHEVYARDGCCTKDKIKRLWYNERDYFRENYGKILNIDPINDAKTCKRCKGVFPISAYRLLKHKRCPAGYRDWLCLECRRKQNVIDCTRKRGKSDKVREAGNARNRKRYQVRKKEEPDFMEDQRKKTKARRNKMSEEEKKEYNLQKRTREQERKQNDPSYAKEYRDKMKAYYQKKKNGEE
jgi:hypothetical protein